MTRTWKDVWAARRLNSGRQSVLESLMEADGLDTGFGNVTEASWRTFVASVAARLDLSRGTTVFEVGCGSGAFLYPLSENGCAVSGLDQSDALIAFASQAMPDGRWQVGDAASLDTTGRSDVVLACGVFMYFADLDYARRVLARMAGKGTRAIAVLDVPDLNRKTEALAFRRGAMGEAEYENKYRGLDHLFYDRDWMRDALAAMGASEIRIEDQAISGYQNARFRFNAFARLTAERNP